MQHAMKLIILLNTKLVFEGRCEQQARCEQTHHYD